MRLIRVYDGMAAPCQSCSILKPSIQCSISLGREVKVTSTSLVQINTFILFGILIFSLFCLPRDKIKVYSIYDVSKNVFTREEKLNCNAELQLHVCY